MEVVTVDTQDDIPQALERAAPGFVGVHITRTGTKYRIEFTYAAD